MLLKPAKCTVKGFAIEELDPVTNFRRPFSLGFINFVEDRSHVPQFMLASQDLSLQNRSGFKNSTFLYLKHSRTLLHSENGEC